MNAPHTTVLTDSETFSLGELRISHPPGTFPITPASRIALEAIGTHRDKLTGLGIDWGSGSGVLSLAAAKIATVEQVIGLDIAVENVSSATANAEANGVSDNVAFYRADAFLPFEESAQRLLTSLRGRVNFVLANPPSSEGDDGFSFRRAVLRDARDFLVDGGVVFLNISLQYGQERIRGLLDDAPGYTYGGVLASTDWVPFDCERPDLLVCLERYAVEESRGGMQYEFGGEQDAARTATAALDHFRRTGQSPLTKWQQHLFVYGG